MKALLAITACLFLLQGCATASYRGSIWTDNAGVTYAEMNHPGKMVKGDCSIDMQTPSFLRTLMEATLIKGLEVKP